LSPDLWLGREAMHRREALDSDVKAAREGVLTVQGDRFLLDGHAFDDYRAHGVNAITVFYQGCRGGNYDPFSPDGRSVDHGHQRRMEQIIEACRERGMVVVVGIFYQAAPFGLRDAAAVRAAVRRVTENLKPFRNIIINIANEQNSAGWKGKADVYDFNDPQNVLALCDLVHQVDADRLVGGGGYNPESSLSIGKSPGCDVLLFDTAGPQDSAALYDGFVAGGVTGKPIVNVETFGGWTKQFERGVFPEEVRRAYVREVDAAVRIPGLSIFFHNNPWCQNQEERMRYDLGGAGTKESPGIRWYFEYVRQRRGKQGQATVIP